MQEGFNVKELVKFIGDELVYSQTLFAVHSTCQLFFWEASIELVHNKELLNSCLPQPFTRGWKHTVFPDTK